MTFKHILFPVDLSAKCEAARPVVEAWARRFNAKVTLLHTVQIPITAYGGADGYPIVIDIPNIESRAKLRLDGFAFSLPDVTRISTVGDPAFEAVQYTEKNGVDLIMMPTHGYGKFRSLLLGSTAAKVLHDAACPVWTSAHTEEIPAEARTDIHNVLCAIELGAETAALIRKAQGLAQAWQAKLQLVHAVPADETWPERYLEGDYRAELVKTSEAEVARIQKDAGTNLDAVVEAGTASHVIREAALKCGADLVITGHGKLHETFGKLRTSAYAIIRDSPCPVLST
ncbi:MAG TPA: universal stress protein [Bryobacteraceae bacterium]|nr:universal stress protein [Bryobacteraceae bacterium]